MKDRDKGFASVLAVALLLMVWVAFASWVMLTRTFEAMQIIEGEVLRNFIEKGKFEISMIKESQEQPALIFAMMKTVLDYASHGMITSKLIAENGITYESGNRKYVLNMRVNFEGVDRGCMRIEDVDGEYVLYWVQAEGTGMQVYKPISYFKDFNGWIGRVPTTIEFSVDPGFRVGEVMLTLYFLKNATVTIKSGGTILMNANHTGVYFLKGDSIEGNRIEIKASRNNTVKLRGIVATIYKHKDSNKFSAVGCGRDMIQEIMERYLEQYYRGTPTNMYGMTFKGSKPNVTFDPSTNTIHGSVWMSEGMNVTRVSREGKVTVMLHSNMFTETNVSTRLGLMVNYGNTFVDNIEEWLIRKIFEKSNEKLQDYYTEESEEVCRPLTCNDCPEDKTPTYGEADFENVITSALSELEADLNASSAEGIGWKLIYLDDKHVWESVNDNKKPCCDSATPSKAGSITLDRTDDDTLNAINDFMGYNPDREDLGREIDTICAAGTVTDEDCSDLISRCNSLKEGVNVICSGHLPSSVFHDTTPKLEEYCNSPYIYDLCNSIQSACSSIHTTSIDDFCLTVNSSYNSYISRIDELINELVENKDTLAKKTVTETITSGCGLEIEGTDKNLIHVERQVLIQKPPPHVDCYKYCCPKWKCKIAWNYWHKCTMKYYHRYIFKDLKILVEIIDSKYKLFDVSQNKWTPVVLRFIVNVNVDDNKCNGGTETCVPDDIISNTAITPQSFGTYSVELPEG